MADLILTGASRGIGRALALSLSESTKHRLVLVARDRERLEALVREVEAKGRAAVGLVGDLSSVSGARSLGAWLAEQVAPGATLVHNAGIWPSRREMTGEGLERAFVVNHLAPLAMQQSLLDAGRLARVMVVSAGLIVKGRFDPKRTPTGEDFSGIRTYCTTKLCFAMAMRDVAAAHPEVDVLVLHPGVVRTDLGSRRGPLGWLLSVMKRSWEAPDTCAARLTRILSRDRWSPPGDARWWVEEQEQPWPVSADTPSSRAAVRETTALLLVGVSARI